MSFVHFLFLKVVSQDCFNNITKKFPLNLSITNVVYLKYILRQ